MELMIAPGRLDRPVDHETDHVLGPADAESCASSTSATRTRTAGLPTSTSEARDQLGDRVSYAFRQAAHR